MRIERYQSASGRVPFEEWFNSLDSRRQIAVDRRINVLEESDHFGDCRALRHGLFEMRLQGVGLRIYFTRRGREVVLLLGGSDKGSQNRTIKLARKRLIEFTKRST